MIAQLEIPPMTPQEYLQWEEQQPIKYEYINGEVYAMTGGTIPHNDTLKEYVLIDAEKMSLECDRLNENNKWELTPYFLEKTAEEQTEPLVELTSVSFQCPMSLLYEEVVFPDQTE